MRTIAETHRLPVAVSLLLLIAGLLSACGGGGGGDGGNTVSVLCQDGFPAIGVGETIANAPIAEDATHCYSFSGTSGTSYTLTLVTLSGDLDIAVHSDPSLTANSVITYSVNSGTAPEIMTFPADDSGTYYVEVYGFYGGSYNLTLDEGTISSVFNEAPVAVVDAAIGGLLGEVTYLDGSASTDPDGHPLTYEWTLVSKPATSNLSWTPQTSPVASVRPDALGDYRFQLIVSDSLVQGDPVTTTVTVDHLFEPLDFQVTDAEYSDALESLVMVSADSVALYTFETTDGSISELALPLAPTSVSVSPDGLYAAVGHNGWISHVDLNTLTLVKTFPVTTDVLDIVLDGNGYAHAFPRADQWVNIRSVNIATEVESLSTFSIYAGTLARLHPSGTAIYGADTWRISPEDIEKYDISGGPVSSHYDSPYHGDFAMCGNLWVSEDGLRIFTRCGNVFRSSPDQAEDMTYNGALPDIEGSINSLSHSREAGKVAAITTSTPYEPDPMLDTELRFYDYEFLTEAGRSALPGYGWFVFYNSDGTRYFVIAQTRDSSGLLDGFGVLMPAPAGGGINARPVADAGPNQAAPIGSAATLDGSFSSDADGDSLSYAWQILSVPTGSTAILVDSSTPSPQLTPDLPGDYVIGLTVDDGSLTSMQDTVTVRGVNPGEQFLLRVDYRVADAEYSDALERLVIVSSSHSRLYMFDAVSYEQTQLELPLAPNSVSIGPDGLYATVGHNGWISYVDLTSNTVVKTFPVTTDVFDIVLAGNGYVHAFPHTTEWDGIRSINIDTEVETSGAGLFSGAATRAQLHPDGSAMYGAENNVYPSDIEKYDVTGGTASYLYDSPYHGDYPMCGNLWISEDGLRIFTRCGNVFRASSDPAQDMTYNGALPIVSSQIESLSHSVEVDRVAAIVKDQSFDPDPLTDTEVRFYNYDFLTDAGSTPLPYFTVGDGTYPAHGRFVFYNSDGTQYFVIVQADSSSGLLNDYGISVH